jgi:hypothetical protein
MLIQPNDWSCLPTAFAMVTHSLPRDIFEFINHDGSEIIWPELPEPYCRRSFAIDEMIDYCVSTMHYPVEVCQDTSYAPEGVHSFFQPYHNPGERWKHYLKRPAVLLGFGKETGERHAVAWCQKERKIFDPNGSKYDLSEFECETGYFIF